MGSKNIDIIVNSEEDDVCYQIDSFRNHIKIAIIGSRIMNKYPIYFLESKNPIQRKYEALRAFHVDNLSGKEVALKFCYSLDYFNKLRSEFHKLVVSSSKT